MSLSLPMVVASRIPRILQNFVFLLFYWVLFDFPSMCFYPWKLGRFIFVCLFELRNSIYKFFCSLTSVDLYNWTLFLCCALWFLLVFNCLCFLAEILFIHSPVCCLCFVAMLLTFWLMLNIQLDMEQPRLQRKENTKMVLLHFRWG